LRGDSSATPAMVLGSQLSQEQAHLTELLTHLAPAHPDVIASQVKIAGLKKQLEALPKTAADAGLNRSVQARLQVIEQERARLADEQKAIESRINAYQAKVDAVPLREEQLSGLTRDYETARDHYRSLLEKSYAAQMATELESKQDAERFEILDPAVPPDRPSAPNRSLLSVACALVSIVAGFVLAYFREYIDGTVKTETELHKILPADVELLGLVSTIRGVRVSSAQRTLKAV
jgi:succinoglycan biosynthesis transport protein ExoP